VRGDGAYHDDRESARGGRHSSAFMMTSYLDADSHV
jgi:hypothetical protein